MPAPAACGPGPTPRRPCARLSACRARERESPASFGGVRARPAVKERELAHPVELLAKTIERAVLQRAHRAFAATGHASHIRGSIPLDKTEEQHRAGVGLKLGDRIEQGLPLYRAGGLRLDVLTGLGMIDELVDGHVR